MYIAIEGTNQHIVNEQAVRVRSILAQQFPDKQVLFVDEAGRHLIDDPTIAILPPRVRAILRAKSREFTLEDLRPLLATDLVITTGSLIHDLVQLGICESCGMDSIFEINRRNIEMVTPDIVVYLESQRADEAEKRGYREVLEYALSTRAIAPHVIVRRGSDLLNWENTFVVIDDLKPLILNRLENSEGTYMRVEAKV